MRQLKIAKTPTPSQAAEAAVAQRWLAQQPVPVGLDEAEVARRRRYVVAVARQYQNRGLSVLKLVEIGYRAGLVGPNLWGWRVRAGMVGAVV